MSSDEACDTVGASTAIDADGACAPGQLAVPLSLAVAVNLEHLVGRLSASCMALQLAHLLGDYRNRTVRLTPTERARHLLRLSQQLPAAEQLQLLLPLNLLLVQSRCDSSRWRVWRLTGLCSVLSPLGCRKAARRLQQLDDQLLVHATRHATAVWFFVCERRQLQLPRLGRQRQLRACTVVWFPDEPALYSTGAVAPGPRFLLKLANMLGYVRIEQWPLADRNLDCVRQRYLARLQHQSRLNDHYHPQHHQVSGDQVLTNVSLTSL